MVFTAVILSPDRYPTILSAAFYREVPYSKPGR